MKHVSRISCLNNGGFVQEVKIIYNGNVICKTGKYPNPQSRIINLNDLNLPEGAEVWIEVHAILGKTKAAWEHVIYSRASEDTAIYRVTGTIWSVSVRLEN